MISVSVIAAVLTASFFAGSIGALLGLGGGIIIIPFLTLVLGIDIRYATGASIISVIATSNAAAAVYVRNNMANIHIGIFLLMATTTGAVIGAFLTGMISARLLYIIFAVVLGTSSLTLYLRRNIELPEEIPEHPLVTKLNLMGSYYDQALGKNVNYRAAGVYTGFITMFFAGIISGILGIGNGVITVISMDAIMKLPMKVSTTTSNFMIGVTATASAAIYFMRGYINPVLAAPVAVGVLLGATIGPRIMVRLQNTTIRKIFLPILIFLAFQMLLKGFWG